MSKKLSDWANIAEMIGAAAIVVTLIVLIIEIRSNTDAVQAQTLFSLRMATSERTARFIENRGGIVDLLVKGQTADELTAAEDRRVFLYYLESLEFFEWTHNEVLEGRLPEASIGIGSMRTIFQDDRARATFDTVRGGLDPRFVEFIEENILVPE